MLVRFLAVTFAVLRTTVFCNDSVLQQSPYIHYYTTSLTISEGGDAVLQCYADGSPPLEVVWERKNARLLSTGKKVFRGNVLIIPNITKDDCGTYYCTASNGLGLKYQTVANVVVLFAPLVSAPKPYVKVALPFEVSLQCRIQTYPLSTIMWLHKGIEVLNNSHYNIVHDVDIEKNIMISTLYIKVRRKHHFGKYICRAWNDYGVAETKIKLKRKHPKVFNKDVATS